MKDQYLILTGPGSVDGGRLGDADVKVRGAYGFDPGMGTLEMLDLAPGEGACIVRVQVAETVASLSPELAHA